MLWRQAREKSLVHAYLLAGPKGVGKATLARALAASLFCASPDRPCGNCESCLRVFTGNEPDIIELFSEDGKAISIDRVREAIALISQHSFGTGSRVVLIEPVEKLTPAAQNCLLKSLEDPPSDVVFFLLSHEQTALLGTIASRCAIVRLSPWPDETVRSALLAAGYPQASVEAVLPRAGGVIGLAASMIGDETAQSELYAWVDQALAARKEADIVSLSTSLKDNRDGAEKLLTALEQALHQALLSRTGLLDSQILLSPQVRAFSENCSTEGLTDLIGAVFDTRKKRQSQVNWQAGIDRLLMKIVEAKTRWQQS